MNMRWLNSARFVAVLALGVAPAAAWAGDFMDTRITFGVSDDNLLQGPQTTNPASPSIPNFLPSGNNVQFFDNYDTRFTGFETLSHLAVYKRMPSFFKNMDTEASLVLRALVLGDASVLWGDAGSYLRLAIPLGDNKERSNISIVAFPVSADRFRLGYSFAISWGGNPIFPGQGLVPGFKVTITQPMWYAYVGAKSGVRQQNQSDGSRETDTVWGLLGGAGVDFTPTLTLEANGGLFRRGTIDKREVQTEPWMGYGASTQLSYHLGLPIGSSIDFQLYRNDPDMAQRFFLPEIYDDQLSVVVKTEFSLLGQNLQHPEKPTATRNQWATTGDLNFAVKYKKWRFHADLVYRSLAFILYNVPSNPAYVDFPKGTNTQPEFFGAVGIDYFIDSLHLTPGVKLGIQRPAFYRGAANAGNNPSSSLLGTQTFVFRDSVNVDILDANVDVQPIFAMTASAKWDFSEIMSCAGQVLIRHDTNRTTIAQDPNGIVATQSAGRKFLPPLSIGFNLILQARF